MDCASMHELKRMNGHSEIPLDSWLNGQCKHAGTRASSGWMMDENQGNDKNNKRQEGKVMFMYRSFMRAFERENGLVRSIVIIYYDEYEYEYDYDYYDRPPYTHSLTGTRHCMYLAVRPVPCRVGFR